MKILFLSYSDFQGGAARAAFWLAKGLRESGCDVEMLVEVKITDYFWVKTYKKSRFSKYSEILERLLINYLKLNTSSHWSLNLFKNNKIITQINKLKPDIINVHWIGNAYINLSQLSKLKIPIVISLYDMWQITAGCHYDNFCRGFTQKCNNCPQLNSINKYFNFSGFILNSKKSIWENKRVTIVSPSIWLADAAEDSVIFKNSLKSIKVIPHGTNLDLYKPIDKIIAKNILNLDNDYKYILFGSSSGNNDLRKGFQYLIPALKILRKKINSQKVKVLIFGESEPEFLPDLGFEIIYTGRISDDISLNIIYSSADLTVTPSTQEAFGMTASESMACGTPVVSFGITGPIDVIDHKVNGYLAKPFDIIDLAAGMEWVLETNKTNINLSLNARKKCETNFNLTEVSKTYLNTFNNILK